MRPGYAGRKTEPEASAELLARDDLPDGAAAAADIRGDVQVAVGALHRAPKANAVRQNRRCKRHVAVAVQEHHPGLGVLQERDDERAVPRLPLRAREERAARRGDSAAVAGPPRRDHRVRELLQVSHRVRLVIAPIRIRVPAPVSTRDELVDLVVLVGAVLDAVRLPAPGSEGDPLWVAVAERVDTVVAGLVHERVVAGRAAVRIQAQHLAVEPVDVLRRGPDAAVAGRDPQFAAQPEAHTATVMEG